MSSGSLKTKTKGDFDFMLLGRNEDFRSPQASIGGQTCPVPFDVVQPLTMVVVRSRTKVGSSSAQIVP